MAIQIMIAPLKEIVFFDSENDVKIAGRPTLIARVSFTTDAKLVAVVDTGRDFQFERFVTNDASLTVTGLARVLHYLTGSLAMGTGPGDAEKSLLEPYLAITIARRTGSWTASLLGARTAAFGTA